ncbi:cytochrome P450 4c21-like [Sabethes cyaneus]|uniref:cytochrome P450 4c21-like n=1 Tax=Sabethes cyaneus TaxID=53552 RepID=UPI00237DD690|nr:cytochrome P450 4c21-like [Sabethes cyaneus]
MTLLWKTEEERFRGLFNALNNSAKLFKAWLFHIPLICTSDPDMIQKILTSPQCVQKPHFYDILKFEFGLLVAHSDVWKRQRKALNPSFNQKILHGFIPIFDRTAQTLAKKLSQYADGEKIQITDFMTRCTLEMVCATTIDCNINEDPEADKFSHLIDKITEFVLNKLLNPLLCVESIYRLTKHYKMEEATRTELSQFVHKVFRNAKAQRAKRETFSETANDEDYRKPKIFIDQLLDLYDQKLFNDIEMFDNVVTMIVAGTDTSGTVMGFVAHMLAIYPHLQEKVYQEISGVFPANKNLHFTPENLSQLQYTEMFIKETLRHFPLGPMFLRAPLSDIELDEVQVPADIWGPEAEEFNPDNFFPERIENRHPFAFLPFSGGIRNCIGYRYAMISMKVMMVHLLTNFRFKSDLMSRKDLRLKYSLLLKLSEEPGIKLERRLKA